VLEATSFLPPFTGEVGRALSRGSMGANLKSRPLRLAKLDTSPINGGGKFCNYMHALAVESHASKFNPERVVLQEAYIW